MTQNKKEQKPKLTKIENIIQAITMSAPNDILLPPSLQADTLFYTITSKNIHQFKPREGNTTSQETLNLLLSSHTVLSPPGQHRVQNHLQMNVKTQANDSISVETVEPEAVEHQEYSAEVTSVLDLSTTTKEDSVDVEMTVPENNPSKVEGDTKERDLERSNEKTEPRDVNLVVTQQVNAKELSLSQTNNSSATCSGDEDVNGETERQRIFMG